MRSNICFTLGLGIIVGIATGVSADGPIARHPSELKYPKLDFKLPTASELRTVLTNGVVVYIDEDRMLPTLDMTVMLRAGAAIDPTSKTGLASLVGEQMRDGGTKSLSPSELDEKIEFLAASMSCRISDTRGTASFSSLSKDMDEGLALFFDMLRNPRFDAERLRLAKERMLQNIKRRNDRTSTISRIEWGVLMNGEEHFSNRYSSSETINAITRDDLFAFHAKYIHPGNMIIALAGDFDRDAMIKKLNLLFADWREGETGPTAFPNPHHTPKPGVYVIHKEGVNQGRVTIGHKAIKRGSPDEFPVMIMNGILGAAGFRSRLVARVRSDEGLAYNTGSRFRQGVYYPGDFQCWFQSKSNSCAYATKIVIEEITRLREERVSQADIDDTIAFYAESFPQRFQSKLALLQTYAAEEYTGRDPNYWQRYVPRLQSVTVEDVYRVAKKYLHPSQLVILAVGDADAMLDAGYDKAPDLTFGEFGKVVRLPLRNPDTLER